ncbi:MAG: CRTAC1 family protein [Planctomycetota bacterium]|nr:CRTAC1 family protein [Planctomycetota bacterium]
MTQQNGGGVALFDFDADGQLDVFLVNGSHFELPAESANATNRLYRGGADWQFSDITVAADLEAFGHGMGCTVGDYDSDGFPDLYVACYGRNRLWQNAGDGTFEEVTDFAGVGDELWGTSPAFADLDGDGLLDLYVVNYVHWSPEEPPCMSRHDPPMRLSCSTLERIGQSDVLYKNLGDGRFEEVGKAAGIAIEEVGKGMALTIADLDEDGRLDVYVANDTTPNYFFRNLGSMRFEEVGVAKGVAISENGDVGAGMGVACADYDRDGHFDLSVTNFRHQINDVFRNLGAAGFVATNTELGLDYLSTLPLGFGIVMRDFNLDGWPDLFVANGHIWDLSPAGQGDDYEMLPQLFLNEHGVRFREITDDVGEYFRSRHLGRAAAFGDLDNDGDFDLVVAHMDEPVALLRNDALPEGRVLRLRLIGTQMARQPLGARVEVRIGDEWSIAHIPSGESFQASHDERVILAVGDNARAATVRVWWPGGEKEEWKNVATGELVYLIEGQGRMALPHTQ